LAGRPRHCRVTDAEHSLAETKALGLYRADSEAQLTDLLRALPLYDWMKITVTPLEAHPNDPGPPATASAAR
jgi:muconolactone delta-isomerase